MMNITRITIGPLTFIAAFYADPLFIAVDVKNANGFDIGALRLTLQEWEQLAAQGKAS